MEERTIRITLRKHDISPLLAATSDDLNGLIVFGRTWQEIEEKLPIAIRELFEAMKMIAETGHGPKEQLPSMGCSIKWKR